MIPNMIETPSNNPNCFFICTLSLTLSPYLGNGGTISLFGLTSGISDGVPTVGTGISFQFILSPFVIISRFNILKVNRISCLIPLGKILFNLTANGHLNHNILATNNWFCSAVFAKKKKKHLLFHVCSIHKTFSTYVFTVSHLYFLVIICDAICLVSGFFFYLTFSDRNNNTHEPTLWAVRFQVHIRILNE